MGLFDWLNPSKDLQKLIAEKVATGTLSDSDLTEIIDFAHRHHISQDKLRQAMIDGLEALAAHPVSSQNQHDIIFMTMNNLGIELHEVPKIYAQLMAFHAKGIAAGEKTPHTYSSDEILLNQSETIYLVVGVYTTAERLISQSLQGFSTGVGIHATNKVLLSTTRIGGKIVDETDEVIDDEGAFILTNQRLIYKGDLYNHECTIKALLQCEFNKDEIIVRPRQGKNWFLQINDALYHADYANVTFHWCLKNSKS